MNKGKGKTKGKNTQVQRNVIIAGNKTGKNTKRISVVSPERKIEGPTEIKQYVFNPQFSTPTSLPLSFFFGYQILHEMKEWEQRGHVRIFFDNFRKTNFIQAFLFSYTVWLDRLASYNNYFCLHCYYHSRIF